MGSEKYPDENYYDSFVSSHGGGCNAFTEGEHTVYNFDITPDHFAKGLDIFANCFISPLLADSAVDREVNAIDNEFNSAILDDGSRLQQLFSHFAPDEHILHKFSWGNRKSIIDVPKKNKVNARKVLRDFHEQNYTPNSMKLVVMSSAPIEELRCNVLASFQNWNVKSGGERPTKKKKSSGKGKTVDLKSLEESLQRSTQLSLFNSNDNLTVRRFFPVKDCHKVAMYWELPSMVGRYRSKPHGYLGHLLGHEGPGSLLSKLKELNFATDLSAGTCDSNFDTNSVYTLFTLSISLTEKGIVNWPQVVCVVYQYLSMLKATPPQKWIFDELQQMTKIGFGK